MKKHGLADKIEDIDHFVRVMETGGIKLPEVEADLSNYQTKIEEARNEFQAIRQKKQKMECEYQNQKRLLEKDLQATRQNILHLTEVQEQIQQSFDITFDM